MVPTHRDSGPGNWSEHHNPTYFTPSFPPEATHTPGPPLSLSGDCEWIASRLSLRLQNAFKLGNDRRKIIPDCFPHDPAIDGVVAVAQSITEIDHRPPRKRCMLLARLR